ncbi:hypothetical protein D3C76_431820 [compost metagenome]
MLDKGAVLIKSVSAGHIGQYLANRIPPLFDLRAVTIMNAPQDHCQCFIQPIRAGFHQRGLIGPFGWVRAEFINGFGIFGNLIG